MAVTSFQYELQNSDKNMAHLAIGSAHGVVSDKNHKKPLAKNSFLLNYAKCNDVWYAQVGIATGEVIDVHPNEIWPGWGDTNTVVHGVYWDTSIVVVPDNIISKKSMSMSLDQVELVIDHILESVHG